MNEMEIYRCQMQRARETGILPLQQFQYALPYLPYRGIEQRKSKIFLDSGNFITRYFEIETLSFYNLFYLYSPGLNIQIHHPRFHVHR